MIKTYEELAKKLELEKVDGNFSNERVNKFIDIVKNNEIESGLFKEILEKSPEIVHSFNDLIGSMNNIGKSIEETKRLRWEVLRDLAKNDKLTSEQIIEVMKILGEIEKNESVDWTKVFQIVAVSAITVVGLAIRLKK